MDLIGNVRIVEDTLAFVLLGVSLYFLLKTAGNLKGIPLRVIPIALIWGLIPLFIWKTMGMIRRLFLEKASNPELYKQLHDIGEVFESLSGLVIALSLIVILTQLRKLVAD